MVICVCTGKSMQHKTTVNGYIRAVADQTHPFQTKLSLIITDFEPNNNKQGIHKTEAENILRTAAYTPLKIHFDGEAFGGHVNAKPIGPIVNAYASNDNGRDVIAGDAIIWNDMYPEVAEHLKVAFAEGVGTSWEIYYEDADKDENGIEWLKGCVFAGTCVVNTPAYGPNRTRLLAIAEKLNERDDTENNERLLETMAENQKLENVKAESDTQELRTDISGLMDVLGNIYNGLYEMLDSTYELEAQLATTDMPAMAEQFTKLVKSVQTRFNDLVSQAQAGQQATAELTDLKNTLEAEKIAKAEEEKKTTRLKALSDVGIEVAEEKLPFYLSMDATVFDGYVADIKNVKATLTPASAETKPVIPNVIGSETHSSISIKDVAAAIRNGEHKK